MICYSLQHLNQVFLKYDQVPVECDGHTLIVSNLLTQQRITHKRVYGEVILSTGQVVSPHFWITSSSYIIDYRLRMWGRWSVSDPDTLPHGIFSTDSVPSNVIYAERGSAPAPMLNDAIINLMTDGYWTKIKTHLGLN